MCEKKIQRETKESVRERGVGRHHERKMRRDKRRREKGSAGATFNCESDISNMLLRQAETQLHIITQAG